MAIEWTDEQAAAIATIDRGVVVPAAAGSGKTAVLIERTVRMLEDPDPETGCPAEKLLAVTFTKQAAAQMKRKLRQALLDRIVMLGDSDLRQRKWLETQHEMLELANISTIDSFCYEIVKNNIDEFDYRNGLKIADETEAKAIIDEAARLAVEQLRREHPEKAELLTDAFSNKDDSALLGQICELREFLRSLAFPEKWIDETQKKLSSRAYADSCAAKIMNHMREQIDKAEKFEEMAETVAHDMLAKKYLDLACDNRERILDIIKALDNGSWEQLFDVTRFDSLGRLTKPPMKGLDPEAAANEEHLYEQFSLLFNGLKAPITAIKKEVDLVGRDIYEPMQSSALIFSALIEAVRLLEKNAAEMKIERGIADFSDIARMALDLLVVSEDGVPKRTPLAERIVSEDTYRVMMIDEYQDVNNLQETIFRAISKTTDLNVLGSNVFVVGDRKQSIYRFRQSNPRLFSKAVGDADDPEKPWLKKISLTKNFRSRKVVIDLVNAIFGTLMSEEIGEVTYSGSELLRFGAQFAGEDQPCEVMLIEEPEEFDDDELKYLGFGIEELVVANKIREMLENGVMVSDNMTLRKARPSDFCVLTRSNDSCGKIADALRYVGLKAKNEQSDGYIGSREIMIMISLLRVIDDPIKDTDMATVMGSPIMGFTADDLARLRIRGREVLAEEAKEGETAAKNMGLRLIINRAAKSEDADEKESRRIELSDETLQEKCVKADQLLRQLEFYAVSLPLDMLITKIYDETGFLASASAFEDPRQRRANLRLLVQYAAAYEKNYSGGIAGFLSYLSRISESGKDFRQAVTTSGGEDSVNVMTEHRSKGLEFPFVIMAKMNTRFSGMDISKKVLLNEYEGAGLKYYRHDKLMTVDTVGRLALKKNVISEQLSEEMRLLYVALTRAKEKLILPFFLTKSTSTAGGMKAALADLANAIRSAGGVNSRILFDCHTASEWLAAFLMQSDFNYPLLEAIGLEDMAPELAALARYEPEAKPSLIWSFPKLSELKRYAEARETFVQGKPQPELVSQLVEKYSRKYHGEGKAAASKRTVTEIVAEMRREESSDEKTDHSFFPQLGSLTEEAGRLTAAQRGTFTHLFMELADYDLAEKNVSAEIERLLAAGRMSPAEAGGIYTNAVKRFFESDLYRRMKASDDIRREMKFMVSAEDAGLYEKFGKYIDRSGMLQGVCDCIFREPDGYVLVDYKTDGFTDISQLDTYHTQLELYRSALELILPMSVKACYIYSFKLAEGKEITL